MIVGKSVIGGNYRKKRIKIAFHPLEQRFEVANPAIEKDGVWIPDIAPLYQPEFDSFNFVIDYCIKNQLDNGKRSAVNDVLTKLQQIQNNSIGIIELPNQLDIARVTEIFICINSKGVILSQADFAMSKISSDDRSDGNQIRKTMDYFCHLMQKPEDFEVIRQRREIQKGQRGRHRGGPLCRPARQRGGHDLRRQLVRCGHGL